MRAKNTDYFYFLRHPLGEFDLLKVVRFLMIWTFFCISFPTAKELLSMQSYAIQVQEMTDEQGFYQSDYFRIVYPPDFLQLKEIKHGDEVVMASITEKGSHESSIPRFDTMIISPISFLEADKALQEDVFHEFASVVIASYYGETIMDTTYDFAGLPVEIISSSASFADEELKASLEVVVDPYKDLPAMTFRVSISGDKELAEVSVLATHVAIIPEIEDLFLAVYEKATLAPQP